MYAYYTNDNIDKLEMACDLYLSLFTAHKNLGLLLRGPASFSGSKENARCRVTSGGIVCSLPNAHSSLQGGMGIFLGYYIIALDEILHSVRMEIRIILGEDLYQH